ncbi:MAG: dehydrogenase [Ruminococcaceae bacterium]|nr:dehydrogenase [Oscillospiraceae bacterium]
MPKSQYTDPNKLRAAGKIKFKDIPVNQYKKSIKEERKNFTDEQLLRMYHDMAVIREFETMLNSIKKEGRYNDTEFMYAGPAHLSAGQEATAVGQAYILDTDDFVLGSHRSHGEILAKGLSAIEKLSDEELTKIMSEFLGGKIYNIVKEHTQAASVKELAREFLIYGAMAEIFARDTGFNKGFGGSMHAFFLPFGIYPNNAIVGGSAPVATGVALYKKCNKKKGIVVANIGDGSLACGPVYESMNFAAMDQMKKLWEGDYKGGLPILFNFNNNSYAMGGQTCGETMGYEQLARIGAGINPEQMHAERVDGWNPLAVIDAMKRVKKLLTEGQGPCLLDLVTYRFSGHSTSDASTYRTKEEMAAWEEQDPIVCFRRDLVEAGVASDEKFDEIWNEVRERNHKMFALAIDEKVSPFTDYVANPDSIEKLMFSNQKIAKMDDREAETLLPYGECPRKIQLANKARFAFDAEGKPVPKTRMFGVRDALFEAIHDKYYEDPTLISYGEDVRDWGGAYAVYRGLTETLPYNRLFNSPISEAAIVGSAVGYAMAGGRIIVELMYADFIGRAGDEIFNQLSKWQAMSAGLLKMPVVVRVSVGSKYGAQHSQDWTALISHIPGLKCVFPVTPYDAKGLMTSVLNGTDPVVFFESQRVYDTGEQFHQGGVPTESYEIALGEPDVKKEGKDITILTVGATLYVALKAAKELEEKYGISAEIIDARSIVPFNYEKVVESVKKTGKILLASDACARGSILNEFARNITELAFDYLDAPPVVVGSENWITPAHEYEKEFFPQPSWIIDAIHEKIMPIAGYVAQKNYTPVEQMRKAKFGV